MDRVGEIWKTNEGYEVEIIEYFNNINCTIIFKDVYGQIVRNVQYINIKKGTVKNFYHPSVWDRGFIGIGEHKTKYNKKVNKIYQVWGNIFRRCYDLKFHERYPTYINCEVSEKWLNFQNFGEWFEQNYVEGFELDKDILVKGNKVYSSKTCCFVPKEVNTLFTKTDSKRGDYPIGVHKKKNRYGATINKNHKIIYLGYFNTPKEAFEVYKIEKELWIKEVAEKWRPKLTPQAYQALMNYKVEITD